MKYSSDVDECDVENNKNKSEAQEKGEIGERRVRVRGIHVFCKIMAAYGIIVHHCDDR